MSDTVKGLTRIILQAEGAAVLALSLGAYAQWGGSWVLFGLLILAPDLAMIGYALGNRLGAAAYNAAHTHIVPLALLAVGVTSEAGTVTAVALIWIAHIGFDRMLGYGLKYETGFGDTHLSGKARPESGMPRLPA